MITATTLPVRNERVARLSECLVGDETGTVILTARNDQGAPGTPIPRRDSPYKWILSYLFGRRDMPSGLSSVGGSHFGALAYVIALARLTLLRRYSSLSRVCSEHLQAWHAPDSAKRKNRYVPELHAAGCRSVGQD